MVNCMEDKNMCHNLSYQVHCHTYMGRCIMVIYRMVLVF